ncbi:MAG: hypothetical protein WAW39_19350 [Prosthecobacter sp.]|uniref:hypothetical protein n=1 Tax=Prosthecobacter sp. TaxID=1965333 RepID=UPI003BB0040B
MATLEDAAELLRPYRAEVIEEKEGFFVAKLSSVATSAVHFKVPVSAVDNFLKVRSTIHLENDTSIFYPDYFEQAIETMGSGSAQFRIFRRNPTFSIKSPDGQIVIELSGASEAFLFQLGKSETFRAFRRRMLGMRMEMARRQADGEIVQMRTLFSRVLTVKVRIAEGGAHAGGKNRLRDIAISGLFNIAFATGVGLTLSTSWERSFYQLGRKGEEEPHFPKRIYNKDLVAYYQLALSSDSPILAFLTLYKVLEFFFTSASENVLHKRLADKIAHPDFTHKSSTQLRLVASMVRKFDQKMDEQRMLATVLEQHFMPDEIISWIEEFESSEPYFTKPQSIFGQPQTLDINSDRIHASLAARIYLIRNALVHNKEGELSRFTPFSGQEAFLFKETPLMLFLAENLIAKTGTDL